MNDLTKMRYSPRVMAQGCTKCGAPKFRRCKSPRGEDTNAHQPRLMAAGYVLNKETKEWRSEPPITP